MDFQLKEVRYYQDQGGRGDLSGLKLVFANGLESPLYENDRQDADHVEKTLSIDPEIRVASMQVKSDGNGHWIKGFKFSDEDDKPIAEKGFNVTHHVGSWSDMKRIPDGQRIIGFKAGNNREHACVFLRFILGNSE